MIKAIYSILSLLLSIAILLAGSGMLSTLLGLRGTLEGFSELTIGLIMSAFFAGYILGSHFCPKLIRRVGHIRTFVTLAATASVASLLHALLVNPWAWGLLRLVVGACVLGIYLVIESWLSSQSSQGRGRLFAVYMMVSLTALGAGQFLIVLYGAQSLESFALVAMLFCLGLIPMALTRVPQPVLEETRHLALGKLFAISHVGAVGSLVAGVITGAFWGLSAVYAVRAGLSDGGVATFVAAAIFGGALLQWPIGHLSDRFDRRQVLTWVSLCGAGATALIFVFGSLSLAILAVIALLFGGFAFSLYALSVAQTHDRMDSADTLGATRGLLLLNGIGATLGPLLVGILMHLTSALLFPLILGAILLLLALYARHRIHVDPAVPPEERSEFVLLTRTSDVALEMDPRVDPEQEQGTLDLKG